MRFLLIFEFLFALIRIDGWSSAGNKLSSSRPPIHLLHSINQYCVMKKRDLFAMKERDLKFNKTVKFSLSVANLRNQATLYDSLDIYLRHTLIILSGNID